MESETFLKRLSDHKDVLSTFSALRSKMINEGTISGPRLTKLINAVGADMSMGDMAVHLMYMSMFSHPRTWLLPAIENTINFGMTLTTESLSALSRGRYFDEIIGLWANQRIMDNLGLPYVQLLIELLERPHLFSLWVARSSLMLSTPR
jgi:hypothetical protein